MTSPPPSPTIIYDTERTYFSRRASASAPTPASTASTDTPASASASAAPSSPRRQSNKPQVGRRRSSRNMEDYGTNPLRRDSLLPPDVPAILDAKRRRSCGNLCGLRSRPIRVALMCVSVLMSAVQANGVYCWPT